MLINRKKIIIAFILVFLFIVLVIVLAIFKSQQNPYGDSLFIRNLSSYTKNKQTNNEKVQLVEHLLYKAVDLNTKRDLKKPAINDIFIRGDSFKQSFDKNYGINTVSFVVDIASLKQSYKVSYQWTDVKKYTQFLDEYGTQVTCLPIDELKYGNFNCIDERILERGVKNFDPVGLILPYHVEGKFKVVDYEKESDKTILDVEAYAPRWVVRLDQPTLDSYTNDIKIWLKSRKLDPESYTINYTY